VIRNFDIRNLVPVPTPLSQTQTLSSAHHASEIAQHISDATLSTPEILVSSFVGAAGSGIKCKVALILMERFLFPFETW